MILEKTLQSVNIFQYDSEIVQFYSNIRKTNFRTLSFQYIKSDFSYTEFIYILQTA